MRLWRRRARRRPATTRLFDPDRLANGDRAENVGAIRALCTSTYVGGGTALCRVLGRYKMYVAARDVGLSSHLMLDGFWEMWVTELLVGRLRPGMVVVDVGANVGYFTVLMADRVGPTGHVHAFEPNPAMARLTAQNAHVNGFRERVTVHEAALGEVEGGRFRLFVPEDYPGGAALVPAPEAVPGDAGLVAVGRLDGHAALLDADIIKIDVEGSEEAVWKGMTGILDRRRPLTILLEFVRARYDDPEAFLDSLGAHGFALHHVDAGAGLRPITRAEVLAWPPHADGMLVLIR